MYLGHVSGDGRLQPLFDHLSNVAKLASEFAGEFGASELGYQIGLSHDIGKYSSAFQRRLFDGPKVDHATAGAQELFEALEKNILGLMGAYCVLGHHGGLPDGGAYSDIDGDPTLWGRLKKSNLPHYDAFLQEVTLQTPAPPSSFSPLGSHGFSLSFLTRMLFSCLVDADYLDTEKFMQPSVKRAVYESIDALHQKLLIHLKTFSSPKDELNRKRCEIMSDCIQKAEDEKGLYTLTVPTGGGKTISSLAFALTHTKKHKMKRIIYVIPFTSIIEQNAAVFADALGAENVLEHHANVDYDDKDDEKSIKHLAAENWDAPVVVTTNVQFFESLLSNKTSRCRKLHNIADSVIIFDEAQMLPLKYLHVCIKCIEELVHNYGCTVILCSATQPALGPFFDSTVKISEICSNPPEMYEFFRRTTFVRLGNLSDETLAERLNAHRQALCIVSTRKQAQNVFAMLDSEGSFHLSTLMTPEHRSRVLKEIRRRLKADLPCRAISTSLIEAGVDVDFPVVYRAKAGLDSIIQAAGRCNREGKHPREESFVYVFEPEKSYTLPAMMEQFASVYELTACEFDDLGSLEAIKHYFTRLYHVQGENLDAEQIVSRFDDGYKSFSFPFKSIASEFKLIDDTTCMVLIPHCDTSRDCAKQLRAGFRSRNLIRTAARYSVNIFEHQFSALREAGAVEALDTELGILCDLTAYSQATGLATTYEGGKGFYI